MSDTLRILVVVAHPDEAEEYVAGTLAQLADRGHHVKVLSTTNGDAGHRRLRRKPLALRRAQEAFEAMRILNLADYEIWDVHDGDLTDTLENRHRMIKAIRHWQADLVITFSDEGEGHPDNRTAGLLVRNAIGLLALATQCPKVPVLARRPIVLRMMDDHCVERHRHDLAVGITATPERKLRFCAAHAPQFLEFSAEGREWGAQTPCRCRSRGDRRVHLGALEHPLCHPGRCPTGVGPGRTVSMPPQRSTMPNPSRSPPTVGRRRPRRWTKSCTEPCRSED